MTNLRAHNRQQRYGYVTPAQLRKLRDKAARPAHPTPERALDRQRVIVTRVLLAAPAGSAELQDALGLANIKSVYAVLGNLREEGTIERVGPRYRLAKAVDTTARTG